jgi:predicted transcriptional regulator
MSDCHFKASNKGYEFFKIAVDLMIQNENIPMMQIYEQIANKVGKSRSSVERSIRYAINTSNIKRGKLFNYYIGNPVPSSVIRAFVYKLNENETETNSEAV